MVPGSAWCVLETTPAAATEPFLAEAAVHCYLIGQSSRVKSKERRLRELLVSCAITETTNRASAPLDSCNTAAG